MPAISAARTVKSRAVASNEAGTVKNISCDSSKKSEAPAAITWFHAWRICFSNLDEASIGEIWGTSSGAPHGSSGAVRSAPE